jgi:hypothetical protein
MGRDEEDEAMVGEKSGSKKIWNLKENGQSRTRMSRDLGRDFVVLRELREGGCI